MNDTLISRLANCRAIAAERLPAADVATIDDAIAALAQPAVKGEPVALRAVGSQDTGVEDMIHPSDDAKGRFHDRAS